MLFWGLTWELSDLQHLSELFKTDKKSPASGVIWDLHMLINRLVFGNFEFLLMFSSLLSLGSFRVGFLFVCFLREWDGVVEGRLTPQINFCKILGMVI